MLPQLQSFFADASILGGLYRRVLPHRNRVSGYFEEIWSCGGATSSTDRSMSPPKALLATSTCLPGPPLINRTRFFVPAADRPSGRMARRHSLRSLLSGLYLLSSSRHLEQRFSAGLTMVARYPLLGQSEQSFRQCQNFEPIVLLYTGNQPRAHPGRHVVEADPPNGFGTFAGRSARQAVARNTYRMVASRKSAGRLPCRYQQRYTLGSARVLNLPCAARASDRVSLRSGARHISPSKGVLGRCKPRCEHFRPFRQLGCRIRATSRHRGHTLACA